ncbi:MAG: hypothetical protein PHC34_04825 [Candidatus Gastranaerophilales bacterium]|nr:hypothetical protein [Candidatus Gastranaerophilales bacterium]
MKNRAKLVTFGISALIALNILFGNLSSHAIKAADQTIKPTEAVNYKQVNALDLVGSPQNYLNKKIKIDATFDKFSTLGLDYKAAMRESKNYISFLIKRTDITSNTIPLSELKLIIKREKAEKLINLESGDKIELTGNVFSNALNDPWVDVDNIKVLSSKTKTVSNKKEPSQIK